MADKEVPWGGAGVSSVSECKESCWESYAFLSHAFWVSRATQEKPHSAGEPCPALGSLKSWPQVTRNE